LAKRKRASGHVRPAEVLQHALRLDALELAQVIGQRPVIGSAM
jgi:hypothetical protein